MNSPKLSIPLILFAAGVSGTGTRIAAQATRASGTYLSASDYENERLAFEGDCGSKAHKLNVHDFSNKPYLDVKHDSQKQRYSTSEIFGFRACNGRDYRFSSKFEYEIPEAGQLYVYARDIRKSNGRSNYTVREYYFSVGSTGQIQGLTVATLKQAFPENHRFQALLDSTFGSRQKLSEYDESKRMFKVNKLLVASRE